MAEVGGSFTDGVGLFKIELYAAFPCDGGKMKHGICRTAHRHIGAEGVFKGAVGHNVPRLYILFNKVDDGHT